MTEEQKDELVQLYVKNEYNDKEIMKYLGIGSTQTIYRILKERNVPLRRKKEPYIRKTISFDKNTFTIIESKKPKNLSAWICKLITNFES